MTGTTQHAGSPPEEIGSRRWAIAEGYIPSESTGEGPRAGKPRDPEPIPRDTDYAALIESNVPIVVQHTRLDTRQPALSLLSTIAHPGDRGWD